MNKMELIDQISKKAEISKPEALRVLEVFLESVTRALQQDDPVMIGKFGTFIIKKRAAREGGQDPSTGKKVKINASKVVGFKAGKTLKEAVKE
jgi:DNA-binding protein HU-beta